MTARNLLIIGASGGIGAAVAHQAAAAGWRCHLHGRDFARLEALAQAIPGAHLVPGDLDNWADDPSRMPKWDMLHGLVWAAGICELMPGQLITRKALRRTLSINLEAPLIVLSALYRKRQLADGARVVLVGSSAAHQAGEGFSAYAASKAALAAAARVLDHEFSRRSVSIQCVEPGTIDTPMTQRLIATFGGLKDGHDRQMLQPQTVAADILARLGSGNL